MKGVYFFVYTLLINIMVEIELIVFVHFRIGTKHFMCISKYAQFLYIILDLATAVCDLKQENVSKNEANF